MADAAVPKSWNRRMAEQLAKECETSQPTAEFFEAILEAAGELKAVRCKIMLGRCYETIRTSRVTGQEVDSTEGFEKAILELT